MLGGGSFGRAGTEINAARRKRKKLSVEGLVSESASLMTECCVPQSTVVRLSSARESGRESGCGVSAGCEEGRCNGSGGGAVALAVGVDVDGWRRKRSVDGRTKEERRRRVAGPVEWKTRWETGTKAGNVGMRSVMMVDEVVLARNARVRRVRVGDEDGQVVYVVSKNR